MASTQAAALSHPRPAAALDLDAHRAGEAQRSRFLHPHAHPRHAELGEHQPGDVAGQPLHEQGRGRLRRAR